MRAINGKRLTKTDFAKVIVQASAGARQICWVRPSDQPPDSLGRVEEFPHIPGVYGNQDHGTSRTFGQRSIQLGFSARG